MFLGDRRADVSLSCSGFESQDFFQKLLTVTYIKNRQSIGFSSVIKLLTTAPSPQMESTKLPVPVGAA